MGLIIPFSGDNSSFEDQDYIDEYEFMCDEPDQYRQFGGYNDWSDEAINSAFDGDPFNTWNVD